MFTEPIDNFEPVTCIDYQIDFCFLSAIDQDVVSDTTGGIADEAVADLSGLKPGDITSDQPVHEFGGSRSTDLQSPHVTYVKDAYTVTGRQMFFWDGPILDRHLPARERHHLCTQRAMNLGELELFHNYPHDVRKGST